MPTDGERDVTRLLEAWRAGDEGAEDALLDVVYSQLQRMARRAMASERGSHTLQPTALLHDAYVRLAKSNVDWQNRQHFFAVAAKAMRRVLLDHAKARQRHKRGNGALQVTLDEAHASASPAYSFIDLDSALSRLAKLHQRQAESIELHVLAGMTYEEIAELKGVSRPTVQRDLRVAKAWLHRELSASGPVQSQR